MYTYYCMYYIHSGTMVHKCHVVKMLHLKWVLLIPANMYFVYHYYGIAHVDNRVAQLQTYLRVSVIK